jgi:hypothetical protein
VFLASTDTHFTLSCVYRNRKGGEIYSIFRGVLYLPFFQTLTAEAVADHLQVIIS